MSNEQEDMKKFDEELDADPNFEVLKGEIEVLLEPVIGKVIELARCAASHIPPHRMTELGWVGVVRPIVEGMIGSVGVRALDEVDPGWLDRTKEEILKKLIASLLGGESAAPSDNATEDDFAKVFGGMPGTMH